MESAKHYKSDTPCKKCNGRLRYLTTKNCVPCAKLAVTKRRLRKADDLRAFNAFPTTPIEADLFGDIE